jgi:hypothetical protein
MVKQLGAGIVFALAALAATPPITEENLRMEALVAVFPGAMITVAVDRTLDLTRRSSDSHRTLSFPDAFAKEKIYRVTSAPANEIERCVAAGKPLGQREVRFRLYPAPHGGVNDLIAILQYAFTGPEPDGSCASIGLIAHLIREGGKLQVAERFLLDPQKHESLQNVQLADLTGDGSQELIVESDFGEPQSNGSTILIFDLSQGRLDQVLEHASRMVSTVLGEEVYKQDLDVSRTLRMKGEQFCFTRTVYGEEAKWFPSPKVTRPCYARGRGVDADENRKRAEHLK